METRIQAAWKRLPLEPLFGEAELMTITVSHEVSLDWTSFFGNASSAIEAPEPGDPEFDAFTQINRAVFDEFAAYDRLRLQCETRIRCGRLRSTDHSGVGQVVRMQRTRS